MKATPKSLTTTADSLSEEQVSYYRRNGFVRIPNIISKEEADRFHKRALKMATDNEAGLLKGGINGTALNQVVNAWTHDETMRELTLNKNVAAIATKLAGVPLRVWHDHVLTKAPHNGKRTEWHQDQPYWPHANSANPISCWIALCDVPDYRGCMSFIKGQQGRADLPMQILEDSRSLFEIAPDLEWEEKVTLPLRAGDCTFHHGRTPHQAGANETDDYRVAHVIIYIDRTTTYTGAGHIVTDSLELETGEQIAGDLFPEV